MAVLCLLLALGSVTNVPVFLNEVESSTELASYESGGSAEGSGVDFGCKGCSTVDRIIRVNPKLDWYSVRRLVQEGLLDIDGYELPSDSHYWDYFSEDVTVTNQTHTHTLTG